MVFTARTPGFERQLWSTDFTTKGTTRLSKQAMSNGSLGSYPTPLTEAGGRLFFFAEDVVHGRELWVSNGTAEGTKLVRELVPGTQGLPHTELLAWRDRVWFRSEIAGDGTRIWSSDGTCSGTRELFPGPRYTQVISSSNVAPTRSQLFFSARDRVSGLEHLWVSDGSATNCRRVRSLPGVLRAESTVAFEERLIFVAGASTSTSTLWVSSGTASSTVQLPAQPVLSPHGMAKLTRCGKRVFFAAESTRGNSELWVTDGTAGGTRMVVELEPGNAGSAPDAFLGLGGRLIFSATTSAHGRELYVSDGTAAGTRMIKELAPGPQDGVMPAEFRSARVGGKLLFVGRDNLGSWEPFVTDGTSTGTQLLRKIGDPTAPHWPSNMVRVGERVVYFLGYDKTNGRRVWRTDGTPAGTRAVFDDRTSRTIGMDPSFMASAMGRVFVQVLDPVAGGELFVLEDGRAIAWPTGHACSGASLSGQDPVLGRTITLRGEGTTPSQVLALLAGSRSSSASAAACPLYLDLGKPTVLIAALAPQGREWQQRFQVPRHSALLGLSTLWQAIALDLARPAISTSNALEMRVGY